jgi:hypothetical protein
MEWIIPKMWEGGECWIIGGGPSMPQEFGVPEHVIKAVLGRELPISAYSPYLSHLHDKHVIGVNAAFLLGDWVDVMFFGDAKFYWDNKAELDIYRKLKVSCNPNVTEQRARAKNRVIYDVKYIARDGGHPRGITVRRNKVSWNLNSGAAAINLAYHFGVKRIYLLGFDMDINGDKVQHWHGHYRNNGAPRDPATLRGLPFHRHLRSFPAIKNDAKRIGLEIINVSPESQIKEFRKVRLEEVL